MVALRLYSGRLQPHRGAGLSVLDPLRGSNSPGPKGVLRALRRHAVADPRSERTDLPRSSERPDPGNGPPGQPHLAEASLRWPGGEARQAEPGPGPSSDDLAAESHGACDQWERVRLM